MRLLENIHNHQDLVNLNETQRVQLCEEIRQFLVNSVSQTGGHMSSNLGVVELTVALETVYDTAKDRLVFDVGHQSYIHKLLTGRQADFARLRQLGGMAGFPKPSESECDAFVAGHASSSVSIALGMARARKLTGENYHVVALLGDGAATGGMVYEGLNDAAVSNEPMVVILNDNELSIDNNVGGLASHLYQLRTKEHYLGMKKKYRDFTKKFPGGRVFYKFVGWVKDHLRRALIPTTIFETMGFTYLGPVDGHDTENLITLLKIARDMKRPVLLHVLTQKGRGYAPAQEHPKLFHGIGKFDPVTGEPLKKSVPTFSDAFGEAMVELAQQDSRVCAITAAMPGGTGLLEYKKRFPDRLFDVGIAEEHAVSMAGGLAKQGAVPVVALYSTFLQRSYDMLLQDIGMLDLHTVLAVDRAGLVGEDGETHHGIYDIGFLRHVPGMHILCPGSRAELKDMLRWAVKEQQGPVAIRYPRGTDRSYKDSHWNNAPDIARKGGLACHRQGEDVTLITYGTLLDNVMDAAQRLSALGIEATVLRLLSVKPLPVDKILENCSRKHRFVIVEEAAANCGIGQHLACELRAKLLDCRVDSIHLGDNYVTHGSVDALYEKYGLDGASIAAYTQEVCQLEN